MERSAEKLIGSLFELAELPDMPSEPKLRQLIRDYDDFPIIKRGTNGSAYEIDLREGRAFVLGLKEASLEKERERLSAIDQFRLELLGDDAAAGTKDGEGLTARERADLLEEEIKAIKLGQLRAELVKVEDVDQRFADFAVRLVEQMTSFSARLTKRVDVSRQIVAAIDQQMDADRRGLAKFMAEMERAAEVETEKGDAAPADQGKDRAVRKRGGDHRARGAAGGTKRKAERKPVGKKKPA